MSSKNTGMMSYNELFAMKKNLAHQAKFEHKLTSMKKDFNHRRGNMHHAIKSTVHELKEIQSSTGYSLEEVYVVIIIIIIDRHYFKILNFYNVKIRPS